MSRNSGNAKERDQNLRLAPTAVGNSLSIVSDNVKKLMFGGSWMWLGSKGGIVASSIVRIFWGVRVGISTDVKNAGFDGDGDGDGAIRKRVGEGEKIVKIVVEKLLEEIK